MELFAIMIICIAVFVGFFAQTVVGFGAGIIALPILLLVLELKESVAVMSVYFFIFSAYLIVKEWKNIHKKSVLDILLGVAIGVGIGVFLLGILNTTLLKN